MDSSERREMNRRFTQMTRRLVELDPGDRVVVRVRLERCPRVTFQGLHAKCQVI